MYKYLQEHPRLRIEAISEQLCVNSDMKLANELDKRGELVGLSVGTEFIAQGDETREVYFILAGSCDVVVNGRVVAKRGPRSHVGEMGAILPTQQRSASCIAAENMVLLRVSEEAFSDIADKNPRMYRAIARELARRLLERNSTISAHREKIRIFIISSAESLSVARAVQNAFEHDPFTTVVWTDGVFKIASYPLSDLEAQIDDSDFAIAIAHGDDSTQSRGKDWPSPRDNVIFELGLFMGRLGRSRAILMEPREEKIKLPSDLSGVTTITYTSRGVLDAAADLAPACNRLRDHINFLGPNNG